MAHYKRKKSKRHVKCTICTPRRWMGNSKGRRRPKEEALHKDHSKEIKDSQ